MAAVDEKELKKALKEAFDKVDTDHDGKISHAELKAGLKQAGFEGNDDNVKEIIAKADVSGDGKIDFEEFVAAVIAIGIVVRVMMYLRRLFAALDTDGSGYITPSDIRTLMQQADMEQISDAEINEFIAEADTSGDGKVSFEEFASLVGGKIEEQCGQK